MLTQEGSRAAFYSRETFDSIVEAATGFGGNHYAFHYYACRFFIAPMSWRALD